MSERWEEEARKTKTSALKHKNMHIIFLNKIVYKQKHEEITHTKAQAELYVHCSVKKVTK